MYTSKNFTREYVKCFVLHNHSDISKGDNTVDFTTSLTAFLILLSVLITLSNLLIIIMVITSRQLHKTTYYLIASLATADMLVGLIIAPFFILWLLNHALLQNPFFCKTVLINSLFLTSATIVNLMVLTIERYLAICHTFFHKFLVSKKNFVKITISTVWLVCVLLTLLSLFIGMKSNLTGKTCNYYEAFNEEFLQGALIIGVMIPFVSMLILYVKIFHRTKTHLKQKFIHSHSMLKSESLQKIKHNHKLTVTLSLIFTFFVLAWGPFFSVIFTKCFCSSCTVPTIFNDLIVLFGFMHSLTNPIIYSLRQPNFKKLCRQSIHRIYRKTWYFMIGVDIDSHLAALGYQESGRTTRISESSS